MLRCKWMPVVYSIALWLQVKVWTPLQPSSFFPPLHNSNSYLIFMYSGTRNDNSCRAIARMPGAVEVLKAALENHGANRGLVQNATALLGVLPPTRKPSSTSCPSTCHGLKKIFIFIFSYGRIVLPSYVTEIHFLFRQRKGMQPHFQLLFLVPTCKSRKLFFRWRDISNLDKWGIGDLQTFME